LHGEDVVAGGRLLNRGTRLGPWQIAVAAALGHGVVPVYRRLRVALFSTGDELLAPGSAWRPAGVFDANRPLLAALLAGLPVEIDDHGILRDDPARIRGVMDRAGAYDLVIASGGASQGDEDHVAAQLAAQGALDFWKVAMRPGRPLALGAIGRSVFVALPGNPVAAATSFLRFVRPLVLARAGAGWHLPRGTILPARFHMAKKPGRVELLRCRLVQEHGSAALEPVVRQGSALLSTLLEADGIAEIDADRAEIVPGDSLSFLSWRDLGME
jgi:molybdopterin molybdotransferase